MGANDSAPMPAAEVAAMAAGLDAAFAAIETAGEGADNGAAIVDPSDGRVSAFVRPAPSASHSQII